MESSEREGTGRPVQRGGAYNFRQTYLPLVLSVATVLLLVVAVPDQQQAGPSTGAPTGPIVGAANDLGQPSLAAPGGTGLETASPFLASEGATPFSASGATVAGDGSNPGTAAGTNSQTTTTPGQPGQATPGAPAAPGTSAQPGTTAQPGAAPAAPAPAASGGAAPASPSQPAAQSNVAVNGTTCGPGVRQFAFSAYAPMCVPKFTGDNGGATAHGVTGDTITFTLRNTSDYNTGAQAVGASGFNESLHDIELMVNFLNTQFELYGRKVVPLAFNGQGSYTAEVGGQDQAGANADAQTAFDLGAFADGLPPAPGVYGDALAARKVVSFGLPISLADARANFPYKYQSLTAVPDVASQGMADLICARFAGMPAEFAGDADLRLKPERTFAALLPAQGGDTGGNNVIFTRAKEKCGVEIARHTYDANPAAGSVQAAQLASRLKADGITTVVLFSNVVFSPVMTNAASQSGYNPEWIYPSASSNTVPRQMSAAAVRSMIFPYSWAPQIRPLAETEGGRLYKLADPNGSPQSNNTTLNLITPILLEFYRAIQAAGPNLTPETFGQGWFSQPDSLPGGDYGVWTSGSAMYSPDSSYTLQVWDPNAANAFDGGQGAYRACNEPADILYLGAVPGSGQLKCLG